jgi:hypothetical protein
MQVEILQLNRVGLEGGHVTLRTITSWTLSSLGLVSNYVVSVLSNEGEGLHHMQDRHTRDLRIDSRKLVTLTFNIHQIFNRG